MSRKPAMRVDVGINRSKNVVAITTVSDGTPIASCDFTIEQAMNHIKHVQTAVDMLLGRSPGGIILPDGAKVN